MRNKYLPHIAFLLFAAQLLLMLVSWLLAAANPASGVRSLLSSEGLRWFLGHFSDVLGTPVLLCLLLLLMAYGSLKNCGILQFKSSYRQSRALIITLLLFVVYVGVIVLLVMIPHAVLLSATGSLWPSPFSAAAQLSQHVRCLSVAHRRHSLRSPVAAVLRSVRPDILFITIHTS